jgi:YcxB-like protein
MNASRIVNEEDLTVEYALTRREISRSFLQSVVESQKLRGKLLLCSVVIGISALLPRAVLLRTLTLKDATNALAWVLGTLLFIPLLIFIFGKTSKRTLAISADGISTEIGRLRGRVPWKKVSEVTETPQFVLILGTSGNTFFIPRRAFKGPENKSHFVAEIKRQMEAVTRNRADPT